MILKVLVPRMASNLLFHRSLRLISSSLNHRNALIMQKRYIHSFLTYKSLNSFSKQNISKSDVDVLSQAYNRHGWSTEYFKIFVDSFTRYEKIKDFNRLLPITQFHLQKLKQHQGVDSRQYVSFLYNGIYFCIAVGQIQKSKKWINSLYDILVKNPELGKLNVNGQVQYLQYKVASILKLINSQQDSYKWLNLFIRKFQNFDQTGQVTEVQRFYTYFYLSNYYKHTNKKDLWLQNAKKAFNLIQQGRVQKLGKQSQVGCILSYGMAQLRHGDQQIGLKAFDLVEKCFDWNTPNEFLLNTLKICQFYAQDQKLTKRGQALLQKFQKFFEQKKEIKQYNTLYKNGVFTRIRAYLTYKKYQQVFNALNDEFQQYERILPGYFLIYYDVLRACCQYMLGKIQDGQKSLEKALLRTRSIQDPLPKQKCQELCKDINFLQAKIETQLKPKQKQFLRETKQLIMKAGGDAPV